MNYGQSLQKRIADNSASIVALKEKLGKLEIEQHKLAIALEVFSTPTDSELVKQTDQVRGSGIEPHKSLTHRKRVVTTRVKVKDLIYGVIAAAGFPLTKMDVVTRLAASGHDLNVTTVASTLSKMVDLNLLEKASHSQYKVKT